MWRIKSKGNLTTNVAYCMQENTTNVLVWRVPRHDDVKIPVVLQIGPTYRVLGWLDGHGAQHVHGGGMRLDGHELHQHLLHRAVRVVERVVEALAELDKLLDLQERAELVREGQVVDALQQQHSYRRNKTGITNVFTCILYLL